MGAPNLAWGGFSNGRIPRANLVDIGGGKLAQPDAAGAFGRFGAAFRERWGTRLYVAANQDVYRDYAYQEQQSGTGHHKYRPGTSVHGWARSFDVSGYGSTAKDARHVWMQQNAASFGFSWKYGSELAEPWHWDYIGPITTTAGGAGGGGFIERNIMALSAIPMAGSEVLVAFNNETGGRVNVTGPEWDLVKRARANDRSDAMESAQLDIVARIIQATIPRPSAVAPTDSAALQAAAKAGAAEAVAAIKFPTKVTLPAGTLS